MGNYYLISRIKTTKTTITENGQTRIETEKFDSAGNRIEHSVTGNSINSGEKKRIETKKLTLL
jgi:hypothetical protein